MNTLLKQLLIAVATILVPLLYTALSKLAPGIPLTGEQFLAFAIWLVSGIIGGGATNRTSHLFLDRVYGPERTRRLITVTLTLPTAVYVTALVAVAWLIS